MQFYRRFRESGYNSNFDKSGNVPATPFFQWLRIYFDKIEVDFSDCE